MKLLNLPVFVDDAILISTQGKKCIPFLIRRVFFISQVKPGTVRGKHAHKKTQQALFCIQGSVTVLLDNGNRKKTYHLTKPNKGIFIDRLTWSEMYEFSADAIVVVFASRYFDRADYIRTYKTFLQKTQ